MLAKRKLISIIFMTAICLGISAQTNGNVVVLKTELENITGHTELQSVIQNLLIENLQKYTNFTTVIDENTERKVKEQQRRSESTSHSRTDIIEIGKLVNAKYALFSDIKKLEKTYIFSINFTDLTEGIHRVTTTSKQYKSLEELYAPTKAIDEVTLILCDRLGIKLSKAQRDALQYGETSLSSDQQLELQKREEERYIQNMKNIDAQLQELRASTQADAATQMKKLESQRALDEIKATAAKERAQRLIEDQKRQMEDQKAEAARQKESIQQRNKMSEDAAKKIDEIRGLKIQNSSILDRIAHLEAKKEAFNDLQNDLKIRKKEIDDNTDKEFNVKKTEIENRQWRAGELSNGNPTERAIEYRDSEIAEVRNKLEKQADSIKNEMEKELQRSTNGLLKEIIDEYTFFERTTITASSVRNEKDVQYSIGSYNADNDSWSVTLYFYNNGQQSLGQYKTAISYQNLTGMNPEEHFKNNRNEFLDAIDIYGSLFVRKEPILTFEVDYIVEPWSVPSQYRIHYKELRIKNTVTEKVLYKEPISDLNWILTFPECYISTTYYAHIISPKSKSVPGYILYEFALSAENGGDSVNASNLMHRAAEKGYSPALDYIAQKEANEREKLRIAAEEKDTEAERKRQEKETEKQRKKSYADMLYSSPRLGFVFNGDISLPDKSMQNYAFEIKYFRNDSERKHRRISSALLLPILPIALLTQLPGSYAGGGVNAWINDDGFDALYVYAIIGLSAPLRRIRPYLELGGGMGGMHDEFGVYGYVKGGLEARLSPHISIEAFCRPQGGFHSQEKDGESANHYVGAVSGGIGISFWKIFD